MERPDLKRMLTAIERKQVNLVITKDLSRLGRNYLQTGQLIEDFFPRNGVRYIAVNDGIDTMRDNNDIAPFKNILNEMYSKDISKKVHSSYVLKAQKGQFIGCLAPFGYCKDLENGKYVWDFSVIKEILMNPVYTGAIASQKAEYRFKIGTIRDKKAEE